MPPRQARNQALSCETLRVSFSKLAWRPPVRFLAGLWTPRRAFSRSNGRFSRLGAF